VESSIKPTVGQQFSVAALLDDAPLVHRHHAVGMLDG
jgi:hypothetical protein